MAGVITIENDEQFPSELNKAGPKLVVVDFMAKWCGPCHAMAPIFSQLAIKYPNAVFLKVDVDICQGVAARYSVSAMPTFLFFKNSEKIDQIVGANQAELADKVKLHGADVGSDSGPSVPGHFDLLPYVNKSGCECLNESDSHTMAHALQNEGAYLESDCDEQLIMYISFSQPIKLHSIRITAPEENGPKTVKLFINQTHTLDFDQADSMAPVQTIDVEKSDLQGNLIPVRYVKFQNVQNLLLFVKDNHGGAETTRIDNISFVGSLLNSTNMGDFKRVAGKKGESH